MVLPDREELIEGYIPLEEAQIEAAANLEALINQDYPGRIIISGMSDQGALIQILGITGRSEPSKNRILKVDENGVLSTKVLDPTRPFGDPKTTIYNGMAEVDGVHILSNGDHTNTIGTYLVNDRSFADAILDSSVQPEPDPSHTPRIAAASMFTGEGLVTYMAIVRDEVDGIEKHVIVLPAEKGIGWAIQTYTGDGSTDSFRGMPYRLPLRGSAEDIGKTFEGILSVYGRFVSMAVKEVDPKTGESTIRVWNNDLVDRERGANLTIQELRTILSHYGVDMTYWGEGPHKNEMDLLREINEGESVLSVTDQGTLQRKVDSAAVDVFYKEDGDRLYHLVEDRQVFSDGRERRRPHLIESVSEKRKGLDELLSTAERALREELGIEGEIEISQVGRVIHGREAKSYPGLYTLYDVLQFRVFLSPDQFREEGYVEELNGLTTYFVWELV